MRKEELQGGQFIVNHRYDAKFRASIDLTIKSTENDLCFIYAFDKMTFMQIAFLFDGRILTMDGMFNDQFDPRKRFSNYRDFKDIKHALQVDKKATISIEMDTSVDEFKIYIDNHLVVASDKTGRSAIGKVGIRTGSTEAEIHSFVVERI